MNCKLKYEFGIAMAHFNVHTVDYIENFWALKPAMAAHFEYYFVANVNSCVLTANTHVQAYRHIYIRVCVSVHFSHTTAIVQDSKKRRQWSIYL